MSSARAVNPAHTPGATAGGLPEEAKAESIVMLHHLAQGRQQGIGIGRHFQQQRLIEVMGNGEAGFAPPLLNGREGTGPAGTGAVARAAVEDTATAASSEMVWNSKRCRGLRRRPADWRGRQSAGCGWSRRRVRRSCRARRSVPVPGRWPRWRPTSLLPGSGERDRTVPDRDARARAPAVRRGRACRWR